MRVPDVVHTNEAHSQCLSSAMMYTLLGANADNGADRFFVMESYNGSVLFERKEVTEMCKNSCEVDALQNLEVHGKTR